MKSQKVQSLINSLFISCLVLFLSSIIAFAQEDDVTESPYFSISCADTTGVNFSLLSTDVSATVSGVIANVVVEQTYYNSGDSIVDANYVFPMSTNAAIYAMQMILDEDTIQAVIMRKEEAEEVFEQADSSGLTASLLEQEKPNVFQMSLANVQAGDSLIVRMNYTELLVPTNGVYQFVFPSVVGPRFTYGGEEWVSQSIAELPLVTETDLNINLTIHAGMPLEAECMSHSATFEYDGNSAHSYLPTHPGVDYVVDYSLDDNEIETGLLLYEGEEENFFLSMIQPAKPKVIFDSPPREYIFIMDVSGSMSGEPLEVSKELISNLLTDLNMDDKFNIMFFSGGADILSPTSLNATNGNIEMALEMIDGQGAGGGTWLLPAMETALDMGGTDGYSRTFVIITDGFVTVEKEAYDLIRENLNEANFFAFGIGSNPNRYIIEGIAYVGEGEPFIVPSMSEASQTAEIFKEYIERPVLTNIEATFEGIDVYDIEPLTIPDVFAQRPIIIYGKYNTPAEGSINILGDYADGEVSSTLNFADYTEGSDENIALKYLWARKRIKLMSDYGIASNENDTISIEEEITQLGLQYSLITEYTSFVAVDSSALTGSAEEGSDGTTYDGTGGVAVYSDDIYEAYDSEVAHFKILGTIIGAEGQLRIKLENPKQFEDKELSIHIKDINGKTVGVYHYDIKRGENIINITLDQLSSGMYFATLIANAQVVDTEKFMIK